MKAHIRMHNGTPILFLDGTPAYAALRLLGHAGPSEKLLPTQPIMKRYAQAVVHELFDDTRVAAKTDRFDVVLVPASSSPCLTGEAQVLAALESGTRD